MNPHKQFAIEALNGVLGDDLRRAKTAFAKYSQKQMDIEFGESGKTPRQILEEYEAYDAKVRATIEWVKAQS